MYMYVFIYIYMHTHADVEVAAPPPPHPHPFIVQLPRNATLIQTHSHRTPKPQTLSLTYRNQDCIRDSYTDGRAFELSGAHC